MTINMGPHHPATHGVLRLLVSLEGEVVRDLKPIVGYVHTGIEKNCEDKSYWKVIPFVERMDYLSYFFNMQAFVRLRGAAAGARDPAARPVPAGDPPGAEPDPLAPGLARDLGASTSARCRCSSTASATATGSSTCSRCRPGSGCTPATSRSAASSRTSRSASSASCAPSARRCPRGSTSTRRSSNRNEIFLQRTKGVGIVPRQRLLDLGVTGPLLRAAGEPWDLRKVEPILAYGDFDFQIPVGTVGDGYDRYRVRVAGDARVGADHRAGARRPAGGAVDRRRPQGRAAAARRALDLDGGADPPLQARHRGLPGAAGRGLLRGRVAARRARLLRARRRLGEAGPGPLPRPLVRRTCSRFATCASTATSPT